MRKSKKTEDAPMLLVVRNPLLKCFHYLVLVVCVCIVVLPILIFVFMSFKTSEEYIHSGIFQPPVSFLNFENFKIFIRESSLGVAFKNTVLLIAVSVPISLMMGAMLSYVLDRFNFRFKNLITALFAMAVMIPSVTTQVSVFTVIRSMGLYNTIFAGMVLYTATDITQIYVFRQFMSTIPRELDESGMIDGANIITIFIKIIIPQLYPAFATVAIIKVLAIYNDILIPYLYMPKKSLCTVAQAIRLFVGDKGGQWPVVAAGVILILIPTLVTYLFAQRFIVAGVSNGAVKG